MQVSSGRRTGSVPALLAPAAAADPSGPLLTYYDDATGERTEMSAATLGNWVVKTANLLVDACALGPGDRAAVLLPPHWQTAAVLLGTWTAGLSVDPDPAEGPADVAFVALDRLDEAPEAGHRFVLGLAPMGAPLGAPPEGFLDYVTEVRGQPDELVLPEPADQDREAEPAALSGLGPGDRILVDTARHRDPAQWLLAPLAAGASVVLCANLDPDTLAARIETERVTTVP